ncbi:MAG: radical SAM family heme chaperone HemW [Crocinitomicaceae bacterium]|nr:radical SAM family heme chaperone HemW [Crocinitomicaceae bacterium]
MAGIYVHVPYCKVKCHYCDFHFSTNLNSDKQMLAAICGEIELRSNYLGNQLVSTIYFGGGTPSVVGASYLNRIIQEIRNHFHVSNDCEITVECNPDDLDRQSLQDLEDIGVNRLSIGIQSFDDEVLQSMNRAHSAKEAKQSISLAKEIGFENITIDLIYGIPGKDLDYWKRQLDTFLMYDVPHLSAYCLTIEPNTVFNHLNKKGELKLPSDETSLAQFKLMVEVLKENGYQHYEISNFAKDGFISRHNSAYWLGQHYLGIGPSAHSYNGKERGWNISNNTRYIKESTTYESEELTDKDKVNDHILTRLRTHWGIDLNEIQLLAQHLSLVEFDRYLNWHIEAGNLVRDDHIVKLTSSGKFIADKIASDLFV